jgi:hypothetical protein
MAKRVNQEERERWDYEHDNLVEIDQNTRENIAEG